MRIELNCRECGGNRFTLDHDATDEAQVECGDCGRHIGTVGQLTKQVAEEVMRWAKIAKRASEEGSSSAVVRAPSSPLR